MTEDRQLATRQLITKKVRKLVDERGNGPNVAPVPNEWDNTLEDLEEDPDFEEVSNPALGCSSRTDII
jgi:hypothetical protein